MRILREPNVIAYSYAKVCKLSFENCELSKTRLTKVRFKKSDASRNIDVEQVLLSMLGCNLPLSVKAKWSIENPFRSDHFGNWATNYVGASFLGKSAKHVGRGWSLLSESDSLCIFNHVVPLIRTGKHLWKHYDLSPFICCISNHLLGLNKIRGSVASCFYLKQGKLKRLSFDTFH